MCDFFSFRTDGAGKIYYLNAEQRKEVLAKGENPDSHTFIAHYYGFKGEDEDMLNAYEYNSLTKEFKIDRMNNKDDSVQARAFCENLDYKTVVPELIVKPIVNPLRIKHGEITETDIERLKQWIAVMVAVRTTLLDTMADVMRDSLWDFVGGSVRDSLWNVVGVSVLDFVWSSVRDFAKHVIDFEIDSIWDFVWAYVSSFFNLPKWKYIEHEEGTNPFQCAIDLWESGLVPSFDGYTWRLHGGRDAGVLYELKEK